MSATDVLDRVKSRVGWEGEPTSHRVEAGHVRRFCEAIGDDNPRWLEEAPPTFVVALGSEVPTLPELLEYGKGWLNGGDRFEYLEPIRIGDTITVRSRFKDAFEKRGSSGNMLFVVFEYAYLNQRGRTAMRVRGTRIRR